MRPTLAHRPVAAALAAFALFVPAAPPLAAPAPSPAPQSVQSNSSADLALDDAGAAIVTKREERLIAPGLELTSFGRISADGWLTGQVLVARLGTKGGPRFGYIGALDVAANATVSEMVAARGAIAGVNADFFDINNSGAALGTAVEGGALLKSANAGRERSVTFGNDGLGRLAELFLEGRLAFTTGGEARSLSVAGLNVSALPTGGLGVYDSAWGDFTRARPLLAGESGVEVQVGADGGVLSVGSPAAGRLPDGVRAVVARPGAAADALRTLAVGAVVDLAYSLRADAGDVMEAVGGDPGDWLLQDGEITSDRSDFSLTRHPRTAIGFDATGTTAYLVVVDGRQVHSIGMQLPELGELMSQLGAVDAINLDGGGSSEMVARLPGDASTSIINSPSDGFERRDANGLGLFMPEGSGLVHAYELRTAVAARGLGSAANPADTSLSDSFRVFPGLHRTLTAKGYDETHAPVAAEPETWTSTNEDTARVAPAGTPGGAVVTGVAPGVTSVRAEDGAASGEAMLTVLGPLTRVALVDPVVTLATETSTAKVMLTGYDALGYSAPIEASDVTVTGDNGVAALEPATDGSFTVRASARSGAASFTLTVGDVSAELAVAVSLDELQVADFSDASRWTAANDRAAGVRVAPAAGHDGTAGLSITYNFTQSTGTRGAYAVVPDGGRQLPGQPRKVTVWINGDGNGSWVRMQVRQANGVSTNLDGPFVNWTGWRLAEFPVPDGVAYPLLVQRVRFLETAAARQYTGSVVISDIQALVPPNVQVPDVPAVADPVVVPDGATDDAPLRIAVMSDAQFVARSPSSGQVAGARQTLQEIVASYPDLLVINGDFVDEASAADFDLAKTILDEELAGVDFPWFYVPGNHEIMGGPISNFEQAFGERTHVLDVPADGGITKLVLLDSSTGRLGSDFAQLRLLRDALDDAATDEAVTGVVVAFHHPIDDPLPTKASQLGDRLEANTLRGWYENFRETTGKSIVAVASHVGVFHASTQDGVPYVINGNSGKNPASTPEDGGFTGWSMLGIDPAEGLLGDDRGAGWLGWEVNTRVEKLAISGPSELALGQSGQVSAAITQDQSRLVPVAWPVSAAWGGERVFVGARSAAPRGTVLVVDPETLAATAVAPGRATVTVTVNGVVGSLPVLVPAAAPGRAWISDDNGWDTGLLDSDYNVSVNLWWGENATSLRLYENAQLIFSQPLSYGGTGPQFVTVPVSGKPNGAYRYTCELVNAAGTTPCAPWTVQVRDANPGVPFLSHDNWDGDGAYSIMMAKWWGTQATEYVLYEDGVEVDRQELAHGTGGESQLASTRLTNQPRGTHRYIAVLTNDVGETRSFELQVTVRR